MQKKKIIITGATDGIGLAAAKEIAKKGYHIGLVGRNPEKGKQAIETIISHSGNENLDFFECDLSLVKNVKSLSEQIKQKYNNNRQQHYNATAPADFAVVSTVIRSFSR